MTRYGAVDGDHAETVVGYNDSVRFDYNGDGKFTNTLDLNGDGKITMADWEVGALLVANSWGPGFGDLGLYYVPYRLLATPMAQGGIKNGNRVCIMTPIATYAPRSALKVSVTSSHRNTIALSIGVNPDPAARTPVHVRKYSHQFTYAGGDLPMCGKNGSSSIEIGLDISDMLDSIPAAAQASFFLIVDAKSGSGTVDSLSLMDYTSGTVKQTKSSQVSVPIATGKTYVWVTTTVRAGVLPRILRSVDGMTLQTRFMNGREELLFQFDGRQAITLLDLKGRQHDAVVSVVKGHWVQFPNAVPAGVYFLKTRLPDGGQWTQKVEVGR
jgi:hypothetical protein